MSFRIFTDTSCNLPLSILEKAGIPEIPFSYYPKDDPSDQRQCFDIEAFDGKAYYDSIREGRMYNTSQISPQVFFDTVKPAAEAGDDCLFVSMSSGISGSYQSSVIGTEMLREAYPDRKFFTVDTRSASLAEGIVVMRAAECREKGMTIDETAAVLEDLVEHIYQVFTVMDLKHLHRTGRLSNAAAILGSVLHIRPILKGNEKGQIVSIAKVRGDKAAIRALADKYNELVESPETQTVCIAHADNEADTQMLIGLINEQKPPKEILTVMYEPVTGSHVGPGTVALFFTGAAGVRSL